MEGEFPKGAFWWQRKSCSKKYCVESSKPILVTSALDTFSLANWKYNNTFFTFQFLFFREFNQYGSLNLTPYLWWLTNYESNQPQIANKTDWMRKSIFIWSLSLSIEEVQKHFEIVRQIYWLVLLTRSVILYLYL